MAIMENQVSSPIFLNNFCCILDAREKYARTCLKVQTNPTRLKYHNPTDTSLRVLHQL